MSWFSNIFNITPREEKLQSRICELEKENEKLEEHLEELNYELAKAENLAESWRSCFFILHKNEKECPK